MELKQLAQQFAIPCEILEVKKMGEGFINDTLKVVTPEGCPDYILQRKNKNVFPNVPGMMDNIARVSAYLTTQVSLAGGNPHREVLTPIPLRNNPSQYYFEDESGEFWAVCEFIADSVTYDRVDTVKLAYQGGKGIGRFHRQLAGFKEKLADPIPGFHNLRLRFEQWDEALANDVAGRKASVAAEIAAVESRRDKIMAFQEMIEKGEFPIRVTHNDTKISNMLFDREGNVMCVIDLDTMMSATIFNDFGDAIRSYTNTGAEDDPDLDRVSCSLDYYRAYTEGFLGECGTMLTDAELEWLPFGGIFITFEQVLRFLMDYINGDTYYKTAYPEHNLVRTRAQLRLLESMEAQYAELKAATRI